MMDFKNTGTILKSVVRYQINVLVQKTEKFKFIRYISKIKISGYSALKNNYKFFRLFKNITSFLLPFYWIEEVDKFFS